MVFGLPPGVLNMSLEVSDPLSLVSTTDIEEVLNADGTSTGAFESYITSDETTSVSVYIKVGDTFKIVEFEVLPNAEE